MAVALTVLDARIETVDASGNARSIPIGAFHLLPETTPHIETVLLPGEMITAVVLGVPPLGRHVYRKVRDRASYEFALVSVAVVVATTNGVIDEARVAFGGVAHKPWRALEAEAVLHGRPATLDTYLAAADAALARAVGFGHNDFKIELAKRTLVATLAHAAEAHT
jgi:xanthine dehydrogenase YagS FAD-binding subunit